MKKRKLTAIATAAALLMTLAPCSFAVETQKPIDDPSFYKVNSSGVITGFTGTDAFVPPDTVNGIKIKKISENLCKEKSAIWLLDTGAAEIVGDYAFYNSGLETVTIGENVKQIGMYAFADCSKLQTVYINCRDCVMGGSAFVNTPDDVVVIIPCTNDNRSALLDEFAAAKGSADFAYQIYHPYDETQEVIGDDGKFVRKCAKCGEVLLEGDGAEIDYGTDVDYGMDEMLPFTDVPFEAWYHNYVKVAYVCGIINGKSDVKFDPNANMTLAEAAKIAALVHKNQLGDITEIKQTGPKWYSAYVNYCYKNGIIEDYIKFDWTKPATRAEMAYIFSRADVMGYEPNPDVPLTDIPDVHDTTPYAYEILDLYRKGIAAGSDAKYTYHPDNKIKRSEVSALIARMIIADMRLDLPKG